jgi:hypothetical protein
MANGGWDESVRLAVVLAWPSDVESPAAKCMSRDFPAYHAPPVIGCNRGGNDLGNLT